MSKFSLNPFGEESNSVHAWKERYKQMEIQKNSLQSVLHETKQSLDNTNQLYHNIKAAHDEMEIILSDTKQELLTFQNISKDRAKKIDELSNKLDVNALERIQNENSDLKDRVEELVGEISRGGGGSQETQDTPSGPDASKLYNALIPVILNKFDPENERFQDSFINLIETAITDGDILTQIIAVLFKYGGKGPIIRIQDLISDNKMFGTAIDILVEEQIIIKIDDELHLYVKAEDLSDATNWESLTTEELIEQLKMIVERGKMDQVSETIDLFRDILTERGTSASTIFFAIRKLKEGLVKNTISRKDAIVTINEWKVKLLK